MMNGNPANTVAELSGQIPLTPALSPGEREDRSLVVGGANAVGISQDQAWPLPLPLGEGRGEGLVTNGTLDYFLARRGQEQEGRGFFCRSSARTLTLALSQRERGHSKIKSPNHVLSETMVRAVQSLSMFSQSADKHLLVSIRAVNWTRRGGHQDFQPASQAG